jgi:CHAT domain-containing protein/ankyrin repeat protein
MRPLTSVLITCFLTALCFCPALARQSELQVQLEALVRAADGGDVDEVKRLFELGVPIDGIHKDATALAACCKETDMEMIKLLLSLGADPNVSLSVSPLTVAANAQRKELVQLLLEHGADPNVDFDGTVRTKFEDCRTPLVGALRIPQSEIAYLLLQHNLNDRQKMLALIFLEQSDEWMPEIVGPYRLSDDDADALTLLAAEQGAPKSLSLLLAERKPDPTTLGAAVSGGHVECARIILQAGIEPPPELLFQALGRDPAMVELLLSHGADLNSRDNFERTALMVAAKRGLSPAVDVLLESGAEVEQVDFAGRTALAYAARSRSHATVESLLRAGSELNHRDMRGYTPLMQLGWYGDTALLDQAKPGKADDGWTLLHEWSVFPTGVDKLLALGWERDARDAAGWTALHWCAYRGAPLGTSRLLENGADPHDLTPQGEDALDLAARGLGSDEKLLQTLCQKAPPDQAKLDRLLHQTLASKNPLRLGWILEQGTRPQAKDPEGRNALMLAVLYDWKPKYLEQLVERGADVNEATSAGTALLYAVWYESDRVKTLLKMGADVNLADSRGVTPLGLARMKNWPLLTKRIEKVGGTDAGKPPENPPPGNPSATIALEKRAWQAYFDKKKDRARKLALKGSALSRLSPNKRSGFLYLLGQLKLSHSPGYRLWAIEGSVENLKKYGDTDANFLSRLGDSQAGQGHDALAESLFIDACNLEKLKGQSSRLFRPQLNLGIWQRKKGRSEQSRDVLEQAYLSGTDNYKKAEARYQSAVTAYREGRPDMALSFIGEAETLIEFDRDRPLIATANQPLDYRIWNITGLTYTALSQPDQARLYFDKIIDAENASLPSGLREAALHNLGVTYLREDPKKALELFALVTEGARRDGNISYAILKGNIGKARSHLGQYHEALKMLDESIALLRKVDTRVGLGHLYLTRSQTRMKLDEFEGALSDLELAREYTDTNLGIQARLETQLGDILLAQGNPKAEVLKHYLKSTELLEQKIGLGLAPQYRSSILGGSLDGYEHAIDLLLELDPAQAFELSDRIHSRGLLDLMGNRSRRDSAPEDLKQRLGFLDKQLRLLRQRPGTEPGHQDFLRREYTNTLEAINRRDNQLKGMAAVSPPGLPDIQKALQPDEAILEYFLGRKASYLWLVSSADVKMYKLPQTSSQIEAQVKAVRDQMRGLGRTRAVLLSPQVETPVKDSKAMKELSQVLLAPALGELTENTRLIIVPHGPLHYLPFGALTMPGGEEPLLVRHPIQYAASGSTWHLEREKRPSTGQGVALGALGSFEVKWKLPELPETYESSTRGGFAPLPGSAREVEAIRKLYDEEKALVGPDLTASNLKPFLSEARLVHLATHGILDTDHALFSGLVLADDLLTLPEISNWDLKAELVVLSACDTGLGKLGKGDDMVGLTRAFQLAGARSVLASLWPVSDKPTAVWMENFHGHLAKGAAPVDAARMAALETRKVYPEPYYWAPFMLYGSSR